MTITNQNQSVPAAQRMSMHKAELKDLFGKLSPGDQVAITYTGPLEAHSGTYQVLNTNRGRGRGGSWQIELVEPGTQLGSASGEPSFQVVSQKPGKTEGSLLLEVRMNYGDAAPSPDKIFITGTAHSAWIKNVVYNGRLYGESEDVPRRRPGRPRKSDIPVSAAPAPKATPVRRSAPVVGPPILASTRRAPKVQQPVRRAG